ncbi:MAG: glycosyltransferase [Lachnospiraceae bacterium]|nr:glycosyltransferase [Lachnospiraceae bacterium]
MEKLKIFVSAYACEPGKGSEIGVGWHWVLEMSKYFELWVLTRANNQIPIDNYFEDYPSNKDNIHWIYFDCPDYIRRFKHQMKGVRFYYTLWELMSDNIVKKTMAGNNIEIFHLLTYGNSIWYVSKHGQRKFFIWGPTGGVDTIPRDFSKHYGFKQRCIEEIRRVIVSSLRLAPGFYNKCKNANLIFCKSQSMKDIIPKRHQYKAEIFTDVAVDLSPVETQNHKSYSKKIMFITVGRLDGWRGFDLIIESFSQLAINNPKIELKIIGDGAERKHLKRLISDAGMDRQIIMTGQVSMDEYNNAMKECDVVVNACLKEGGVTNAFDCMAWGKPLICIDTGGYTRNFDSECAIIIEKSSRIETIKKLRDSMQKVLDYDLRNKMSEAMHKRANEITWEKKGKLIRDRIEDAWTNRSEDK